MPFEKGSEVYKAMRDDRYSDRDLEDFEEDEGHEEEEEAEYEEENNQEEEPQLTKEQIEYMERREKLKEIVRQKMKKENALVVASSKDNRAPSSGSFGSFFGPSQPVIAKRVIEEGRGLMDLRLIAGNEQKAASQRQSKTTATNTNAKPTERKQLPKVVDRVKLKAQKLKEARDYSFLLSGEEFSVPAKEQAPPQKTIPASDARPSQVTVNRKPPVKMPINPPHAVHGRSTTVSASRPPHKAVLQKPAPACTSSEHRRPIGSNMWTGPGRPMGTKIAFQKSHVSASVEKKVPHVMDKSNPSVGASKAPLSKQQTTIQKRPEQERQPPKSTKPAAKVVSQRPISTSAKMASNRPASTPSNMASQRSASAAAGIASQQPKSASSSMASQQRLKSASTSMASQQRPKSVSASMASQRQPMKQNPSRPMSNHQPKKRPVEEEYSDEDEYEDEGGGGDYRSVIRQMFGYNPNKYKGMDDDDSDMEVGFRCIEAEERRSARIAKEEDERELALIEEEERRERQRRDAKRLKMKNSQR